ncbi:uncharacterized protein LOC110628290 [Manihot esculenta]|uniref:DUF220 domain-containing protein n=1 Tax=Manihot esculenta TaxID=3983 RepID=A0A251JKP4_MANES|nr:uncharacterized protein LOC110628290 [Manihot esculenta]OAY34527.1 hypothetical protein MANES_12G027600v8 [Manihot esculenta]OAY34528.1 hypothetical protein MANES_12G027600v8 [Manihot esculenta]
MCETDVKGTRMEAPNTNSMKHGTHKAFDPSFFVQLPNKLQNCLKSQLRKLAKDKEEVPVVRKEEGSSAALRIDLERQLQTWRQNPSWVDQPPEIKVTVPKGSLCNINVNVNVGLPPDAVYDIVTDPDNRRVFKNIKEVISRKVLLDEGPRQLVEVEQAAIWRFLWWSGTISVHVLVDQNREDLMMKFKQVKTGFMKKFEGCWRVESLFIDESLCHPFKPKTWAEYYSCTGHKGRIGSKVSLEQIIQPTLVPPPPISWYLRGITTKTTEMIVNDLIAEAARIRGDFSTAGPKGSETSQNFDDEHQNDKSCDIKERWAQHRRNAKKHHRRLLTAE